MGYYQRLSILVLEVSAMIKLTTPILLLVLSSFTFSQTKPVKPVYSSIPAEDLVVVVLSQPESPLRIENARLLFNPLRNRVEYFWDVRNIGKTSVSGYQVEEWWVNGTGGTMTTILKTPLLKGRTAPQTIPANQIIPLTDALRERLKKEAGMSRLVVFLVKDVQFTDGSRFDGSDTAKNVLNYFEKVSGCSVFN